MFQNSSKSNPQHKWWMLIVLPAWVFTCYFTAQLLVVGIIWLLARFNISFSALDQAVYNASLAAFIYVLTLVLVIGAPLLVKRRRTSRADIGINRLPSWTDILIAPAGLITYLILSLLLILLATRAMPWFDINQVQDTGFRQLSQRYEFIAAFATLVVIAPIAEEVLFRGYLFGKLKKYVPIWVAIIGTSVLFGAAHGAWNLAIDTFALSIVLCLLREMTGNIWASVLLHMLKNGIAFYLLFINPLLLATLVR